MSSRSLVTLGDDVLIDGILPYLSLADILGVSATCKYLNQVANVPAVWYYLYARLFNSRPVVDEPLGTSISSASHQYKRLFQQRFSAHVFTWGESTSGRLGISVADVIRAPPGYISHGCYQPSLVSSMEKLHVADIVGSGYGFALRTTEGDLYGVGDITDMRGYTSIYRDNLPVVQTRGGIRLQERGRLNGIFETQSDLEAPQTGEPSIPRVIQQLSLSERVEPKLLTVHEEEEIQTTKFGMISAGRTVLLAVDHNQERIYTWDVSFGAPGSLLQFHYNDGRKTPHKVNMVLGGWGYSAAIVDSVGVTVWDPPEPLQHWNIDDATPVVVDNFTIPGTSWTRGNPGEFISIAGGEGFMVIVNRKGELYIVDPTERPLVKPAILTAFRDHINNLPDRTETAKFVKVFANFRTFAAITDQGDVLFGSKEDHSKIIVHPELQGTGNITDLAFGDHHFLALTSSGQILAWGLDITLRGVFGLGAYKTENGVISLPGSPEDTRFDGNTGRACRLLHPTPIQIEGRVLTIAAGGMQSAAIITK